jgi:ubiquinone/menaquinone biosynthesis C-methylase UbiE
VDPAHNKRRFFMINKGWEWDKAKEDVWMRPSEESIFMAHIWKSQGFRKVLDIGCGKGRHSLLFAEFGFDVSGVDISDSAVERSTELIKEKGFDSNICKADFRELPFPTMSFDGVFSFLTLSHSDTSGVKQALKEIHRILKSDGEMFISINSSNSRTFTSRKYQMLDKNTLIKTKEGPEKGEPHFYADYDLMMELLEEFHIISMNHTQTIYHNETKAESWNYFVRARKNEE